MTRHSIPPRSLATALALAFTLGSGSALAQYGSGAPLQQTGKGSYTLPDKYPVPVPEARQHTPNTMLDPITPEARNRFVQSSLALSPLSLLLHLVLT